MLWQYMRLTGRRFLGLVSVGTTAAGLLIWLADVFPRWGTALVAGGLVGLNLTQYAIWREAKASEHLEPREFSISFKSGLARAHLENRRFLVLPDVWIVNHRPDRPTILKFDLILDWTEGSGAHWHREFGKDPFQGVYQWSAKVQEQFLSNPFDAPANRQGNLGFVIPDETLIPDQLLKGFKLVVTEAITNARYEMMGPGDYHFGTPI